ncbi:phage baseplate assembly protein V [Chrysiogenes arsenatis]|uniref:phage baseplate assembly protein V n=1 Tax=Chrysiogenes arsenatis TaxID=309797 RepID=UPI0003F9C66B|nr:phage baseplate assembly protein V [Chrysiogenes arsenatis]
MDFRVAELERRLDNLIRYGTIAQADYALHRVRVQSGELLTGWIPWLTRRASLDNEWWAPEVGEQVILLSPCGDPAQAVALPAIYQAAHPGSQNRPTVHRIDYGDGGFMEYDRAAGRWHVNTTGDLKFDVAGQADITVQGKATLIAKGTVDIDGGSGALKGAVQGECLCAFTGKPHPHISPTVRESF